MSFFVPPEVLFFAVLFVRELWVRVELLDDVLLLLVEAGFALVDCVFEVVLLPLVAVVFVLVDRLLVDRDPCDLGFPREERGEAFLLVDLPPGFDLDPDRTDFSTTFTLGCTGLN